MRTPPPARSRRRAAMPPATGKRRRGRDESERLLPGSSRVPSWCQCPSVPLVWRCMWRCSAVSPSRWPVHPSFGKRCWFCALPPCSAWRGNGFTGWPLRKGAFDSHAQGLLSGAAAPPSILNPHPSTPCRGDFSPLGAARIRPAARKSRRHGFQAMGRVQKLGIQSCFPFHQLATNLGLVARSPLLVQLLSNN